MYNGSVKFVAQIKDNELTFPLFDFNPPRSSVDKIEIEGADGKTIHSTVYLANVKSRDAGRKLATEVNTTILNRIAFKYGIVIEDARRTGDHFSLPAPPPGVYVVEAEPVEIKLTVCPVVFSHHIPADNLKAVLEQEKSPGEDYYGLFLSARLSVSPVEAFMHLYHILMMFYKDNQNDVDKFIIAEEPSVLQTSSPRKKGGQETTYTRLRNEFAHKRAGVNLNDTKAEMKKHLGGLVSITKRAIEAHP